jgi:8-oxo-dGTP pyrophosphatase MutT (NUDIX family)
MKGVSERAGPPGPKNEWICEKERVVITSPVIEVVERDCRSSEDSRPHKFYILRSRDWCNIIPVTEDGKVVLVKQYRVGVSDHTLEVPGGVTDPGDKDLAATAIREMTEETGYVPLPGARCVPLGWSYPNPAMLDNRVHGFIVGPVRREREQKLDLGEMIEVVELPIEELVARVAAGEISHALMLNTFFFLALRSAAGSGALTEGLRGFTRA